MSNRKKSRDLAEVVPLSQVRAEAGHVMGAHEKAVRRFLKSVLRDEQEQDVEDVLQDMCVRMIRRESPTQKETFPRAYLLTMAMNMVRDRWRKSKVRQTEHYISVEELEIVSSQPNPEEAMQWRQGIDIVREALRKLDPKRREVFLLHRVKKLTLKEIAEETGLPQRSVNRYVIQALDCCREHLDKRGWRG